MLSGVLDDAAPSLVTPAVYKECRDTNKKMCKIWYNTLYGVLLVAAVFMVGCSTQTPLPAQTQLQAAPALDKLVKANDI